MAASAGIGNGSAALWYRVHAVSADSVGGTAAADYAAVLPAALNAVRHRRSFIVGWLSRGGGAPLELITNAGPLSPAGDAVPAGDTAPAGDAVPAGDAAPAGDTTPADGAPPAAAEATSSAEPAGHAPA